MGSVENHQDLPLILEVSPLRIGACHMPQQNTWLWFGLEQERDMTGKRQPAFLLRNQSGEAVLDDESSESVRILNGESRRYVHAGHGLNFTSARPRTQSPPNGSILTADYADYADRRKIRVICC